MRSFEQLYYETEELWRLERFGDEQEKRANLTLDWLPEDIRSVVDVGCGNGFITNQLRHIFIVGIDRSFSALRYVDVLRSQADGGYLPFKENTFDLVLSNEVIEHLPYPYFHKTLHEMVRVSKSYILMSVPYCEELEYGYIVCPVCGCRFHRNYHMRSFRRSDLKKIFSEFEEIKLVRAAGIFPIKIYRASALWRKMLLFRPYMRRSKADFSNLICPQCGYSKPFSSNIHNFNFPEENWTRLSIGQLMDAFWPKRRSFRWWLALYKKG